LIILSFISKSIPCFRRNRVQSWS